MGQEQLYQEIDSKREITKILAEKSRGPSRKKSRSQQKKVKVPPEKKSKAQFFDTVVLEFIRVKSDHESCGK